MTTTKFSPAQQRLLDDIRRDGYSETPASWGNRRAAAVISAWYRTAAVLERKGVISLERIGDHQIARFRFEQVSVLRAGDGAGDFCVTLHTRRATRSAGDRTCATGLTRNGADELANRYAQRCRYGRN